jgi:hypothetical protein
MERLSRSLGWARQQPDHRFALLVLDLDRFSMINHILGDLGGDQVLRTTATRLLGCDFVQGFFSSDPSMPNASSPFSYSRPRLRARAPPGDVLVDVGHDLELAAAAVAAQRVRGWLALGPGTTPGGAGRSVAAAAGMVRVT